MKCPFSALWHPLKVHKKTYVRGGMKCVSAAATDDDCDGGFPNMSEVMAGDAEEGSMTDEVGVLKSRRKDQVFRAN